MKKNSGFIPILVLVIVLVVASVAFVLGQSMKTSPEVALIGSPTPESITEESILIPSVHPEVDGVTVKNIKYTLPVSWSAEYSAQDNIWRFSASTGGFLAISGYDYNKNLGRREFYCQISNYCIDSTSFTATNIGNISGYKADGLDNSGGGTEYFGAKGNKFYIITSFSPSGSEQNEFDKTYQQVLDSLIF